MDVEICEVGPRDGLQNEPNCLSTSIRAEFVNRLTAAGLRRVEVASFVSPARVPQMADAEQVLASLTDDGSARYSALVLNRRGCGRLLATSCSEVRMAFCVTDSFNLRNQGRTVAQSIAETGIIVAATHAAGRPVSVTLAASFGCPFEGPVTSDHVLAVAERVMATGPDELVFADTIGVGVPRQVKELLRGARGFGVPLGLHLHNTRNTGYANAYAGLEIGVSMLDSSLGGIGGCPFAPNATGNVATEDLLNMLEGEGVATGVDLDSLLHVTEWLTQILSRRLPGQLHRAGKYRARLPS